MSTPKTQKPKKAHDPSNFLPGYKVARTYRIEHQLKDESHLAAKALEISENDFIESALFWFLDALKTSGRI